MLNEKVGNKDCFMKLIVFEIKQLHILFDGSQVNMLNLKVTSVNRRYNLLLGTCPVSSSSISNTFYNEVR